MKNQYVGDIGDYGKYGLLKFLANQGIRIGINWYLTENDGSTDGKFTKYLEKKENEEYDPELFGALCKVAFREDKSVQMIEAVNLIPNAIYYNELLHSSSIDAGARELQRTLWFNNGTLLLKDAELIFADPDNGITFSKGVKSKDSEKFVLPGEIARYYFDRKDVVYYCHKGRRRQADWEQAKVQIREMIPDAQILVLTSHRGTQRSYVFVVHPGSFEKYDNMLNSFLRTAWGGMFTREPVIGNAVNDSYSKNNPIIQLEPLLISFSICKVVDYSGIDIDQPFVFVGRTDIEKSLVCPTALVPEHVTHREDGWRAFRVCGELDFSLVGILAGISKVLAEKEIGIFAISTYDTDYVLTRERDFENAITALEDAGYVFREEAP